MTRNLQIIQAVREILRDCANDKYSRKKYIKERQQFHQNYIALPTLQMLRFSEALAGTVISDAVN